ncbi:MAG: hypothetical protein K8U03_16720 [Planctomycetia bacterium]|nr:hypothetical protein [Planctomycetia bacterium]
MLSGNEFSMGPVSSSAGANIVHIPVDASWPLAPQRRDSVAEALHRKWRESRVRLQLAIDIVESPVLLLYTTGEVAATNRAWRMAAKLNDIRDAKSLVGMNYLNAFRAGAAEGNRDSAISAEGIEGVLEGRSRSFYYKYRWYTPTEQRLYAMLAWQIEEEGTAYIAVSHELLEAHAAW